MRSLTSDNDKLKQHFHQTDRTIAQLKRENEELQLKVNNQTINQPIICLFSEILSRKLIKDFQSFLLLLILRLRRILFFLERRNLLRFICLNQCMRSCSVHTHIVSTILGFILQVTEAKKRNDELLYQELNALRSDLKFVKNSQKRRAQRLYLFDLQNA